MDSCWLSASLRSGRPLSAGLGVVFTEILLTPQGMSKGCGYVFPPSVLLHFLAPAFPTDIPVLRSIIEFATRDDAQRAITEFTDKTLLGRPIFIREVRFLT